MIYFSIVITTYNRNNILENAIKSVINQTSNNWECLIIDDGSYEPAINKIFYLIKDDKRFTYVYQKNSGVANAKNSGLCMAKGKYITFLDSDDYYMENHLESRKEILDNINYDLIHGGFKVLGDELVYDKQNPINKISVYDCIVGGTFFIKKDILNEVGGFKENIYSDDSYLYEKIKNKNFKIFETDIKTYIYNRLNEDSITNNYNQNNY